MEGWLTVATADVPREEGRPCAAWLEAPMGPLKTGRDSRRLCGIWRMEIWQAVVNMGGSRRDDPGVWRCERTAYRIGAGLSAQWSMSQPFDTKREAV